MAKQKPEKKKSQRWKLLINLKRRLKAFFIVDRKDPLFMDGPDF